MGAVTLLYICWLVKINFFIFSYNIIFRFLANKWICTIGGNKLPHGFYDTTGMHLIYPMVSMILQDSTVYCHRSYTMGQFYCPMANILKWQFRLYESIQLVNSMALLQDIYITLVMNFFSI